MPAACLKLVPSTALQSARSCHPITQAVDEEDEQYQPQCQPHRNTTLLWTRLPVMNHYDASSPYLLGEATWVLCKSMSKALLNLRQTLTAFHLARVQHFTTESIWAKQAQFAFGKSLLAVPNLQSSLRVSLLLQHGVLSPTTLWQRQLRFLIFCS